MNHFDRIVVGSGFGGSVTAQRLSEADRRVLVLERGKAYPPGSFPRTPALARFGALFFGDLWQSYWKGARR